VPTYIALVDGQDFNATDQRRGSRHPLVIELTASDTADAWLQLRGTSAVVNDGGEETTPEVVGLLGISERPLQGRRSLRTPRCLVNTSIRLFTATEVGFPEATAECEEACAAAESAKLTAMAAKLGFDLKKK